MGKVKYIFLDCDNTLVLSEHLAFEACAELTNQLLEKKGLEVRYTAESLLEDFVGHNFRGMLNGLKAKHGFELSQDELEDYVQRELGAVTQKLSEKATECPNVTKNLNKLKDQGYPMSVVSTSAKSRVVASLKKTRIDHFFPDEHVYSAATSLDPPNSKPDPAIYNYALEQLGQDKKYVVTVEDSKSGATAAMRAGIPCVAYVGVYGIEEGKEKEDQMAELLTKETKAIAVMRDWDEFPEILKQWESKL
ncbi:HAD-like domain-containing protein [Lophiotrema nucula]|uniref:HAD-like domain-containing protein n=1 Tax=Lophiotrema nucula TaxID=690887 RepID=A0A6A5YM43_9PLEO|nr:HAD-like domain-containing protein [Lophiotrema nucula]